MRQEFVYRSHCRELLERVAARGSTKEATAAEVAIAALETSLRTPLNTAAFGLYARMWKQAGFPPVEYLSDKDAHYEAIAAGEIDELEAWSRRTLAVPDRVVQSERCSGLHNGEKVDCTFARLATLEVAA